MKLSKTPGIRLKMTLAFGVVFALLSIALNLYSYHRISQLITNNSDLYLLSRANALLDKTEASPAIIPLPDKNASIKVYIRHAGNSKTLLFQSPGVITKIPLPAKEGVSDTLGMRIAYVSSSSDDNPVELMLAISNEQLENTLQYLLLLLLLSTLLSVVVSGAISFWLAGILLLPVKKIILTARNINAGRLRERVPVQETNDELQELAETINEMLQRIDESLRQQQGFFASASHELKTPLAVMKAGLEVNLKMPGINEAATMLMHSQLEEINRLQKVVEEFLIISQIRANRLTLNREVFDLSDLCLKVSRQLSPLLQNPLRTLQLHFDQETAGFEINADKEKIRLVLANLFENSIKYSPPATIISCYVGKGPGINTLAIRIENVVPEEIKDTAALTNAFYREDISHAGAGLGLWLCSKILREHAAELSLQSEGHKFIAVVVFHL